jgi:hypothetical protein
LKLETIDPPSDILARGGPAAEAFEHALLIRLVALNHERAAEEKRGIIRWLRPDYQNPAKSREDPIPPRQDELPGTEPSPLETSNLNLETPATPPAWPAKLPDQVALIRQLLTTDPTATADQLSARFGRKNAKRTEQIEGILETLRGLGQV